MKILFVSGFDKPDYQNDMIYHGLVNTPGVFVYETSWPSFMLKSYEGKQSLYGKGFTLYARMPHTPKLAQREFIESKIADKYYDYVIYGSIERDDSYLNLVLERYSAKQIAFIDGEDEQDFSRPDLITKGRYFKRELVCESSLTVRPISFCIPEEHVLNAVPDKSKLFATVIPGDPATYVFDDEEAYFKDYASSYYAYTCKKSGFDCLRHYEILANGCLPIFEGIEHIPKMTMTKFPKDILKAAAYSVKSLQKPLEDYEEIMQSLLEHTRKNLTTVKEASRLLESLVT